MQDGQTNELLPTIAEREELDAIDAPAPTDIAPEEPDLEPEDEDTID